MMSFQTKIANQEEMVRLNHAFKGQ